MRSKKDKEFDDMIRNAQISVSPTADFTDRVMKAIAEQNKKVFNWFNLAYGLPTLAVLLVLALPVTRNVILQNTDNKHAAVVTVQEDVEEIQQLLLDLNGDFSSTQLENVEQ